MQTYQIIISKIAEKDLLELFTYIAENDLSSKAVILLEEIIKKFGTLSLLPERGQYVCTYQELDFYEIYHKIYRIIYTIIDNNVIIYGIVDGRRDLNKLLQKRLSDITPELI